MNHTPGPWSVGEMLDLDEAKAAYDDDEPYEHSVQINSKNWDRLASVVVFCQGEPDPEGEANARLIAASPDLLDAAQKLLAVKQLFGETWDKIFGDCDPMYLAVEAIEKAVVKAKGD